MNEHQQTIRTARLDVRPLDMDDLHSFHALWSDPDVIFWGASRDLTTSEQLLTRLVARTIPGLSPSGWFAIIRRNDGAFVGDVVLQPAPWARDDAEVGWHLATTHQGRGYATEAARGLLAHAQAMGVTQVGAVILPDNLASQAVAVRLGMRRTGMIEHGGRPHDMWRIDLTVPDAVRGLTAWRRPSDPVRGFRSGRRGAGAHMGTGRGRR
jgi:RimJ/RimL family protein N-acetyltransferase